jgi:hypothetical protein
VRITANLKALTVEELQGRKRTMHLAAFAYANAETARTLKRVAKDEDAMGRLERDPMKVDGSQEWLQSGGKEVDLTGCIVVDGNVTFTVEGLLGKLERDCEAVLARHAAPEAAERFGDDGAYRAMVEEMLATGAAAISCLRWYLDDRTKPIEAVMRMSLLEGHRGYLGYLARTLPSVEQATAAEAASKDTAERLCRSLGVMEKATREVDAEGLTPLMRAAANGAGARALQSLVAAGAELEARDRKGRTALHIAAECGHVEVVEMLARLKGKVKTVSEQGVFDATPLYAASENGHLHVVQALVRLKAEVNSQIKDGRTPISVAAAKGHAVVVEALGRLKADVNLADEQERTPLYKAAGSGWTEVIEALGKFGADVNKPSKKGMTPLARAQQMGETEAEAMLKRMRETETGMRR